MRKPFLTGLNASLTGTALQEDIARSARRFQLLPALPRDLFA